MLMILWTAKRTNISIWDQIGKKSTVENETKTDVCWTFIYLGLYVRVRVNDRVRE